MQLREVQQAWVLVGSNLTSLLIVNSKEERFSSNFCCNKTGKRIKS